MKRWRMQAIVLGIGILCLSATGTARAAEIYRTKQFSQADQLRRISPDDASGRCWSYALAWVDVLMADSSGPRRFTAEKAAQRMNLMKLDGATKGIIARYKRYQSNLARFEQILKKKPVANEATKKMLRRMFVIREDTPLGNVKRKIDTRRSGTATSTGNAAIEIHKVLTTKAAGGPAYLVIYIRMKDGGGHTVAAYGLPKTKAGPALAAVFDGNSGERGYKHVSLREVNLWLLDVLNVVGWKAKDVARISWVANVRG